MAKVVGPQPSILLKADLTFVIGSFWAIVWKTVLRHKSCLRVMLVLPKFQPFYLIPSSLFIKFSKVSETTLPIYYEFHVMSPVVGLNYNLLYSAQNF